MGLKYLKLLLATLFLIDKKYSYANRAWAIYVHAELQYS